MGSNKTIKINPDLFVLNKQGNKKSQKNKKRKPIANVSIKPNEVRKNLLDKIKRFQQKEQDKKEPTPETKDNKVIQNNSVEASIDFLTQLSAKKENERREKKEKKKNKKKMNKLRNKTLKNLHGSTQTISNYPPVDLSLPSEFEDINIDVPDTETDICLNKDGDVPYGCLKNGKKPTYRKWKQLTQKNNVSIAPDNTMKQPITEMTGNDIKIAPEILPQNIPQEKILIKNPRANKLEEIKEKYQFEPNKKYIRKKTIKQRFKFGKKGNKVSVLIKNNHTRKQIAHEQKILKRKKIPEIKIYLREHGLLKSGSNPPNDVLRQMYEQTILAGNIQNTSKDVLFHNYFSETKE